MFQVTEFFRLRSFSRPTEGRYSMADDQLDLNPEENADEVDHDIREERLRAYFELRLETDKEERLKLQREVDGLVDAHKFTHAGNGRNFKFNSKCLLNVKSALSLLDSKRFTKVKDTLETLETSLKTRNKHIKMADRSPAGWAIIEEYESDDMASNSDDEKKMKRAEKRALKKLEKKKKDGVSSSSAGGRFGSSRVHPYGRGGYNVRPLMQPSSTIVRPPSNLFPTNPGGPAQPFRNVPPGYRPGFNGHQPYHQPFARMPQTPSQQGNPRPATTQCFRCGQDGHIRRDCPN